MNGPEILDILRHELQHAVVRHGRPPKPRPMDVSPWVAMSALQKAIRRGREDLTRSWIIDRSSSAKTLSSLRVLAQTLSDCG
jgi:hypothetical protein